MRTSIVMTALANTVSPHRSRFKLFCGPRTVCVNSLELVSRSHLLRLGLDNAFTIFELTTKLRSIKLDSRYFLLISNYVDIYVFDYCITFMPDVVHDNSTFKKMKYFFSWKEELFTMILSKACCFKLKAIKPTLQMNLVLPESKSSRHSQYLCGGSVAMSILFLWHGIDENIFSHTGCGLVHP